MNDELARLRSEFRHLDQIDVIVGLVERLRNASCFSRCGAPHARDFALLRVENRSQAIASLPSLWEIRGRLYESVLDAAEAKGAACQLDALTSGVRHAAAETMGILHSTKSNCGDENQAYGCLCDDTSFAAGAVWLSCGEAQRFFFDILGYYFEGYWPCGWHGQYPGGKLILF